MIAYFFHMLFAGAWDMIWHWGIGVGLIIIILLLEYFTPPFLVRFKKDMLWLALGVALVLVGEYVGIKDEAGRCVAKSEVVQGRVDDVVKDVQTPASRSQRDPYDSPEN